MTRIEELDFIVSKSVTPFGFDTHSPGDGCTRYRFFEKADPRYFDRQGEVFTAHGFHDARIFAMGFVAGQNQVRLERARKAAGFI